jgi:hypothetical protein
MTKKSLLILISLFFGACYSLPKAKKQVQKAHLTYPIATSEFCAKTYPVTEKTIEKIKVIKGKETIKIDTIAIDCDSIVADKNKENRVFIKYLTTFRTDTIIKDKIIVKENTAKSESLKIQLQEKADIISKKEQSISIFKYLLFLAVGLLLFIYYYKR